jgi:O-antigen ligase
LKNALHVVANGLKVIGIAGTWGAGILFGLKAIFALFHLELLPALLYFVVAAVAIGIGNLLVDALN